MFLRYTFSTLILFLGLYNHTYSQSNCNPTIVQDSSSYEGSAFFNYGTIAKTKSQKYQTAVAIGQNFVGFTENNTNNTYIGFYGRYLLPPFALKVNATQGDLLDRIQLSWTVDGLGPSPNEGFNIYRDGIFLATVSANIRNYNDFNVIAGVAYTYSVRGINAYGEGSPSYALGFQVPNGVVTGWIRTVNGGPVADAVVSLMPMQGFSAKFGAMDQAIAMKDSLHPFFPTAGNDWTLAFWMKTDTARNNASIVRLSPSPLFVRAINSASGNEGIEIATTQNGTPFLSGMFPDSTKKGWHHVSLTFEGAGDIGRLYIEGVLIAQAPMSDIVTVDTLILGNAGITPGWAGRMDEFRIYHKQLNELDFAEVMEGTASSQTPFLSHYWKMDEELGERSYDIKQRHKLYFCGAAFDKDRPPVRTAGKTNSQGYYRIESASYGTGTTFLAEPEKDFYMHKSLKFNRNEMDYATLPNFSLTKKSTIEIIVNNASIIGTQSLLSKKWGSNDFRLYLEPNGLNNEIKVNLNGNIRSFGNLGNGFHHIALTIDSLTGVVQGYRDGLLVGSHVYAGVNGNWSDTTQVWVVGARDNNGTKTDFYNGLIDEVAVYDTTLSAATILSHVNQTRISPERGLRVYFPFDEGNGNRLGNVGSVFLDFGTLVGAEWSSFASNQITEPHIFSPDTRQVTLNPSITSVDQVDFVDRSTVAVSGYVRYKNTDCFAPKVEILVNGASFSPKIFTDSLGKFIIDFDPGATARLTPKFEDHTFVPAFWDVTNVNSPIAGIIFNDVTTRKIKGRVYGGLCKKSVIKAPAGMGQGTVCVVKIRTVDGCLERVITIDNEEGDFEFSNLPPVEKMTVAVVEHSNPLIKSAFQIQGGSTVDLTKKNDTVDFVYFAPPEVVIVSGLEPFSLTCNVIVLDKNEQKEITIKLKEQYESSVTDDGVCYIDSANIRIINGFGNGNLDTTLSNETVTYKFRVGDPNPSPPYLKTLQIIGTTLDGREASLVKQGIVTGVKNKLPIFKSISPINPTLILRDPPGDGSSAFIDKGQKICKTTSLSLSELNGFETGTELHLGPSVTIGLGFGVININSFGPIDNYSVSGNFSVNKISDSSFETCISFNEKISTSESDMIVGEDADLYVGDATNIIIGQADLVTFVDSLCSAAIIPVVEVDPANFETYYIYSGFYIKNYLINGLRSLADAEPDSTNKANFLYSAQRWEDIVNINNSLKDSAEFIKNISFDAGIKYEYSETSDTTRSKSKGEIKEGGFGLGLKLGFEFNDFGFTGFLNSKFQSSSGNTTQDGKAIGITTGYTLADDDTGDAFTVDVAMDSVFNTPVFRTKAGQSSCPWEQNTGNREAPNLQLAFGSEFVATNVPANEPAVFQLQLGNLSASREDWTYGFSAIAANNPYGAVIKLNGQPLNYTQKYIVPYGTSQLVTITIEKGPIKYVYDSLLIAMYSECEYERNLALSIPFQNDPKFFSSIYLGARFIKPCSEVNINVPEQDWVLFPDPLTVGSDDVRRITVSGYDTTVTDFKLIRVQYRRSDGDGAWINIDSVFEMYNGNWSDFDSLPDPKPPTLQKGFTQFFWNTVGLSDGPYEIRAVTVCTGVASDKPGYSEIIKGRINREPPSLIGSPQPSDGVYHVGDEISFTFNKHINCKNLNPIDDVLLIDSETGDTLDINITCFENKIIIEPRNLNKFYENKILRAELRNIEDLVGNTNTLEKWEFYVDRNELSWLTDSINLTKFEDEVKSVTAKIQNRGGYPVSYDLTSIPSWIQAHPTKGTLTPNEIDDIVFTMGDLAPLGSYLDTVTLSTKPANNPFFMGGDEPLKLSANVICRPPTWVINPDRFDESKFSFSMNFIVKLNIEGTLSADVQDIVGAYVDGELRGVARVQNIPGVGHIAFLTVHSDTVVGDTIDFQIWDASECQLYANIVESFSFSDNGVVGSVNNPQILHTRGDILRKIYLDEGWNWISINMNLRDTTINSALSSLSAPNSASLFKSQGPYVQYNTMVKLWLGHLMGVTPDKMYQYYGTVSDSLSVIGTQVPPNTKIPIRNGWNWIGYLPNVKLPVNVALASLSPVDGDIIKNQTQFAVYKPPFGWIGSMDAMSPPNGYLLKVANADTLTYPSTFINGNNLISQNHQNVESRTSTYIDKLESRSSSSANWYVDPSKYEFSMNVVAIVSKDDPINLLSEGDEVGIFVNNEVRGSSKTIYIPSLQSYMMFLTAYSNKQGELLKFKYYNSAEDKVYAIVEQKAFNINAVWGLVNKPEILHLSTLVSTKEIVDSDSEFNVFPNPFTNHTYINFTSYKSDNVNLSIRDIYGKVVDTRNVQVVPGKNVIEWKPSNGVPNGSYMVSFETSDNAYTKKIIYIK